MEKINRKIPKRDYAVFSTIIAGTLLITIIMFVIFYNQKEYNRTVPALRGYVSEIEVNDFESYTIENQNFLLYIDSSDEEGSRSLQEDLVDVIKDKNLKIIYINLKDVDNKYKFIEDFNSKYSIGKDLQKYPAFIMIKDGHVIDLTQKEYGVLNIGDIEQFIEINEIKGESND